MGVSAGVVIAEDDDLLGAASQQQMASDIAKLKADEQDVFDKISSASPPRPAAAPARKPVPVAPPLQSSHRLCAERVKSGLVEGVAPAESKSAGKKPPETGQAGAEKKRAARPQG